MKKSIITLAIAALTAGSCGVWSRQAKAADKNEIYVADDAGYTMDSDRKYLPENYVKLDAKLLALTARKGMTAQYDSLRHAIAFASEVMDLSSFPVFPAGYALQGNYWAHINYTEHIKWGAGMHGFRSLLYYAYWRKPFSNVDIDKLVRRYGTFVRLLVAYEKYVANGWDRIVVQLLTAYDDLSVSADNFGKVYEIMNENNNSYDPFSQYEKITPFMRNGQMEAFISPKDVVDFRNDFAPIAKQGEVNPWSVVWAYSFWGRRYNENPDNIPHLVAALKTVQKLYTPKAKPPKVNKKIPLIEPYLTGKIRPNELLYPWKRYTDRVQVFKVGIRRTR